MSFALLYNSNVEDLRHEIPQVGRLLQHMSSGATNMTTMLASVIVKLLSGTWWIGGALVESIAFNRRVVGSTPALAAM